MAQTPSPAPGRSSSVVTSTQAIAGRVLRATDGHPVANATVTLNQQQQRNGRRQASPPAGSQTTQTDAEGRYVLPPQPAGRYTLRASASGYLSMFYMEHEGFSTAIVTGAGVPTDNLRFALVPEASVHGRVLDDTGEPVRATIMLFRDATEEHVASGTADSASSRIRPAGSAQADDDGQFDFTNLQPGHYYVAAIATPWYAVHARAVENEDRMPYRTSVDPSLDVAYPMTFYPHATDETGATPITLKPGQRATANLLMQAEHAVTVTVQLPPTDASGPNAPQPFPVLFHKVFGNDEASRTQMSGRVGDTMVLSGVAPGQYTLRSFGRGGPSAGETPVSLSAGSPTVTMPALSAASSSEVQIALHTPAGTSLPESIEINLQRVGGGRNGAQGPEPGKVEQGMAKFTGVPAGDYRVRISEGGITWNVSRFSVNGKVVASRLLHMDGGDVKAELFTSPYAPEVDGAVHTPDGKPHAGALVVLVPAGADTGDDLYRADQSDLDGSFQFNSVLPGNYLLVAIDNDWQLNWHDASALMPYLPHALPVTVGASGPRLVALPEAATVQQK